MFEFLQLLQIVISCVNNYYKLLIVKILQQIIKSQFLGSYMKAKKRELTATEAKENFELKRIFDSKKKGLGLTQEILSERLGISQSGLNHYLSATNPLNVMIASKFANELDIAVDEFSPRLANEISKMAKTIQEYQVFNPTTIGDGATIGDGNSIGNVLNHYHQIKIKENAHHTAMPDRSMHPVIPFQSELWLNETETDIKDGKIYLIEFSGIKWYRQLFRLPGNKVKIVAYNEREGFDSYTANLEQVKIFGRVVKWVVLD